MNHKCIVYAKNMSITEPLNHARTVLIDIQKKIELQNLQKKRSLLHIQSVHVDDPKSRCFMPTTSRPRIVPM